VSKLAWFFLVIVVVALELHVRLVDRRQANLAWCDLGHELPPVILEVLLWFAVVVQQWSAAQSVCATTAIVLCSTCLVGQASSREGCNNEGSLT